jgi:hypothetical protein
VSGGERNGQAVFGEDPSDTLAFQTSARAADVGVTMIMAKAVEAGHSPLAVASGAVMAIVRFHVGFLSVPPIEQVIVKVFYPALKKAVKSLRDAAAEAEQPESAQPAQPPRAH